MRPLPQMLQFTRDEIEESRKCKDNVEEAEMRTFERHQSAITTKSTEFEHGNSTHKGLLLCRILFVGLLIFVFSSSSFKFYFIFFFV